MDYYREARKLIEQLDTDSLLEAIRRALEDAYEDGHLDGYDRGREETEGEE